MLSLAILSYMADFNSHIHSQLSHLLFYFENFYSKQWEEQCDLGPYYLQTSYNKSVFKVNIFSRQHMHTTFLASFWTGSWSV